MPRLRRAPPRAHRSTTAAQPRQWRGATATAGDGVLARDAWIVGSELGKMYRAGFTTGKPSEHGGFSWEFG